MFTSQADLYSIFGNKTFDKTPPASLSRRRGCPGHFGTRKRTTRENELHWATGVRDSFCSQTRSFRRRRRKKKSSRINFFRSSWFLLERERENGTSLLSGGFRVQVLDNSPEREESARV